MEVVHYAKSVSDDFACGQRFGLVSSNPKQVTCLACEREMKRTPAEEDLKPSPNSYLNHRQN